MNAQILLGLPFCATLPPHLLHFGCPLASIGQVVSTPQSDVENFHSTHISFATKALHVASSRGSVEACALLLDNKVAFVVPSSPFLHRFLPDLGAPQFWESTRTSCRNARPRGPQQAVGAHDFPGLAIFESHQVCTDRGGSPPRRNPPSHFPPWPTRPTSTFSRGRTASPRCTTPPGRATKLSFLSCLRGGLRPLPPARHPLRLNVGLCGAFDERWRASLDSSAGAGGRMWARQTRMEMCLACGRRVKG